MRVTLIAGALLSALAAPAVANQCPSSIAMLDAHVRQHGSMLSKETVEKVRDHRDHAAKAHSAGDHAGAMAAIQQAHKTMGM